jgi:hypothetical protein
MIKQEGRSDLEPRGGLVTAHDFSHAETETPKGRRPLQLAEKLKREAL